MSFSISYQIIAHDRFTRVADSISKSIDRVKRSIDGANKSTKNLAKSFEHVRSIGAQAFVGITLPLVGIATYGFKAASQIENLQITLETSLQSATKANAMVKELVNFAAKTPFRLEGVAETGRMLLGFGIQQQKVNNYMTMLGDIAAGTGRPMKDLAFVFGQVKAKGRLLAEEINQFAERGLPLLQILAQGTGKTRAEILKFASQGAVSFELFEKAFRKMWSMRYQGNMKKLSKSLSGLWSTLLDTINIGAGKIFEKIAEMFQIRKRLQSLINFVSMLSAKFNKFVDANPKLAKMLVIFLAILAVLPLLLVAIGAFGILVSVAGTGLAALGTAFTVLTAPITLIIAGVVALGYAFIKLAQYIGDNEKAIIAWFGKVKLKLQMMARNTLIFLQRAVQGFIDFMKKLVLIVTTPIRAVYGAIIAVINGKYGEVKEAFCKPFKESFDYIMGMIKSIKDMYTSVIDSISGFLNKPQGNIDATTRSYLTGKVDVPTMEGGTMIAKSQADINVNLNAPKGTVKSVEKKYTGGYGNLRVGYNMGGN